MAESSKPSVPSPLDRAASLHPSQRAEETDLSFGSSVLAPSSTISRGAPEWPDVSFETSFTRPSASQPSMGLLTSLTPLCDVLTLSACPPAHFLTCPPAHPPAQHNFLRGCRRLPRLQLRPLLLPPQTSTPQPVAVALHRQRRAMVLHHHLLESDTTSVSIIEGGVRSLAHTPSTISTVSTVSVSSSIFETGSTVGEYRGEDEPTVPSLLSTSRSLTVPQSLTPWPVCYLKF